MFSAHQDATATARFLLFASPVLLASAPVLAQVPPDAPKVNARSAAVIESPRDVASGQATGQSSQIPQEGAKPSNWSWGMQDSGGYPVAQKPQVEAQTGEGTAFTSAEGRSMSMERNAGGGQTSGPGGQQRQQAGIVFEDVYISSATSNTVGANGGPQATDAGARTALPGKGHKGKRAKAARRRAGN